MENRNTEKRKLWKRNYYKIHRAKNLLRQHVYYQKLRLICLQKYSNEIPFCLCCAEKHIEFLSIDHTNGGGVQHRKEIGKGSRIYIWLIKNNFPSGFQVLCHNCNMAKAFYKVCPHKE